MKLACTPYPQPTALSCETSCICIFLFVCHETTFEKQGRSLGEGVIGYAHLIYPSPSVNRPGRTCRPLCLGRFYDRPQVAHDDLIPGSWLGQRMGVVKCLAILRLSSSSSSIMYRQ
jgi:hypothetical protein